MAGTIEVRPGVRWSAASWIFDWIIRMLAKEVTNAETAAWLNNIVIENVGWLALGDLPTADKRKIIKSLRGPFLDQADRQLPHDIDGRDAVLQRIQLLVELTDEPID